MDAERGAVLKIERLERLFTNPGIEGVVVASLHVAPKKSDAPRRLHHLKRLAVRFALEARAQRCVTIDDDLEGSLQCVDVDR
jgi:hypothetical protein